MEGVPNWYRWLLIAGATLIMCACRAPLIAPSLADLSLDVSADLDSALRIDPTDTVPTQNRRAGEDLGVKSPSDDSSTALVTSQAARALQRVRQAIRRDENLDWSEADSPVAITVAPHSLAPVVRQSDAGVEVQKIDVPLTASPDMSTLADPGEDLAAIRSRFQSNDQELKKPSLLAQQLSGSWAMSAVDEMNTARKEKGAEPRENNEPAPIEPVRTTHVGMQGGEIDEELGSPFADDPGPVDEAPITESEWELAPEPESIHDGMTAPRIRPPWHDYPDEYLCDGGDANFGVQVLNDWSLRNLDPEDTVGHFDTLDGRVVVQPSNQVCIYAPRFAATRKVTAAHESDRRLQPVTAEAPSVAVAHKLRESSDLLSHRLAPQRHLTIQPASVFRDQVPAAEASQGQSLITVSQDLPVHEDFHVIRIGVHKQAEKARLVEFSEAAVNWSHDAAVQVVMDHVAAQTRVMAEGIEEFFSFATKGSPKMRVVKTASRADALPGEVIEFAVRFDNVGHQAIGNVTIVDSLTTRLEYIETTANCSVDANFSVDDNDAESLTLRWEIAEPLNTGDGGIIRFKCRVR